MLSTGKALVWTLILGGVIFFCRVLPFIMFRDGSDKKTGPSGKKGKLRVFLDFVEAVAPPVAMTVLAFNALASPFRDVLLRAAEPPESSRLFMGLVPLCAASVWTAAVHLWKRNALLSISGGTALYMLLERLLG